MKALKGAVVMRMQRLVEELVDRAEEYQRAYAETGNTETAALFHATMEHAHRVQDRCEEILSGIPQETVFQPAPRELN